MPDREKVEKALECCSSCDSFDKTCMKCPYNIHCQEGDTWAIKQDALDLLKRQETMLEMACKVIGYSGLCNTELCTEHCDTNGKYKCVERWLEKEVSKGR